MFLHYGKIFGLLLGFLFLNRTPVIFAQTTDELLVAYATAMGFNDSVPFKKVRIEGTIEVSETTTAYTLLLKPGEASRSEVLTEDFRVIVVFDQPTKRGWLSNSITNEVDWLPLTNQERFQLSRSLDKDEFGGILRYKQYGETLSYIGKEKVQETETYHLRLTDKLGMNKEYYFMVENNALLMTSSLKTDDDKSFREDVWFTDYKEIGGMYIPLTQYTMVGGKITNTIRYNEVDLDADFDDEIFAFPNRF